MTLIIIRTQKNEAKSKYVKMSNWSVSVITSKKKRNCNESTSETDRQNLL